jgi:basic membrane lipoprotein Med (substrate-binding protein (PBP1-ABC) superfamily)
MLEQRRNGISIALSTAIGLLSGAAAVADTGVTLDGPAKPAFLYAGAKDDQGWNQAIDEARSKTETALKVTIPYAENVSEDAATITASTETFIGQGYNVIIGDSPGYADAFKGLAKKHPKTAFINIQNTKGTPGPANLQSVYGRGYESQYLCGVAAGITTKSGNVGFLASGPTSTANWEINGYALGMRTQKPDASLQVIFTGSNDPAKERAAASTLIDHGADVLGQSIDGPTPQIAAGERGVLATGHAVDLHELAPKSAICSSVWTWDRYLVREIGKIAVGNWTAEENDGLLGMTRGATDIACCGTEVSTEGIDKLIAERDGIIITGKTVFSGPLVDGQDKERVPAGSDLSDNDLWAMDWYVKGVVIDR